MSPLEEDQDMEKQKVLSALREGQLEVNDVAIVAAPPTTFFGNLWYQITSLFYDDDDESVADSDCGVFNPKGMSRRERREARRVQRATPKTLMSDTLESPSEHYMGRSERDQTSVTCDLHDSLPSSDTGPPAMPMRIASEHLAMDESFTESALESSTSNLDTDSYVDAAAPRQPVRYETDVSTVMSFPCDHSTFGAESTLASSQFPESVNQQAILIEYFNRSQSTVNSAPHKPVRYDTDVESAVESFLDKVEKAPRKPVRYDTCSEMEESDIDTTADSIYSRSFVGMPPWAMQVLKKLERSEGTDLSGMLPPNMPVRYDTDVESILESLAEESMSLAHTVGTGRDDSTAGMDAPDLEAMGQVVPPDWAIQYLRKVAQSESSTSADPSRSSHIVGSSIVSEGSAAQQVPPIFEVVASKSAPTKPRRHRSGDTNKHSQHTRDVHC